MHVYAQSEQYRQRFGNLLKYHLNRRKIARPRDTSADMFVIPARRKTRRYQTRDPGGLASSQPR
jgi:hypothetical protein